ncbi:MAG: aminoacyl-histidine dipeptidase [Planctomycetota bacterium]
MSADRQITLKNAQAQRVWEMFRQINRIPRCSKNEQKIIEWLEDFANSRNLTCRSDAVGNTVIELLATKGYENAPTITLQSHVDMVCEKTPESKHDFSKDPIEIIERDGWVTANGTTLGADNGLGVALALALSDVVGLAHPRLELLFTVDEETGLTGVNGLERGFITGKYLINLDGEDESLIVGCAGGEQTEITLKTEWVDAPAGLDCFALKVSGLHGGHSGVDIDKKRANAIKLLAKTLQVLQDTIDLRICSIDAGKAANAIPRYAQAVICLDISSVDEVKAMLAELESSFKKEFSATDPDLKIELKKATEICLATEHTEDTEKKIINDNSSIINIILALPTGVYRMSDEFKGTVETSDNLARVETSRNENLLRITTMQRSFKVSAMDELTGKITEITNLAGAKVTTTGRYPGWEPDSDSHLLKMCTQVYVKLHGKTPPTKVVHAGLEPAVIKQKFPDIEAISVGPTIQNPHSPQERLNIASVDDAWNFLLELIPALK